MFDTDSKTLLADGGFMVRSTILGAALLFLPAMGLAQTSTGRVIRDAVIVEQPRGDSRVLANAPPGIVLELLSVQGEWYSVPVPGQRGSTGWINRAVVEPLPGRVPPSAAPAPAAGEASPVPEARFFSRQGIKPHATELSVQGSLSSTSFGGGVSATTFQVDGFGGYFVTREIEVGAVASVLKVTGGDAIGQVGGAAAFNIAPDRPFNGFAGAALGRGFGLSPLNPTFLEVFGGVRVMVPGGGGAFVVRPFWQHDFFSGGGSLNHYGVAFGVSIFF
jgi:hypothetical protein